MGAKRPFKRYLKSEQTNTQTDKHTHRRTFRLIESIGPQGRCFENQILGLVEIVAVPSASRVGRGGWGLLEGGGALHPMVCGVWEGGGSVLGGDREKLIQQGCGTPRGSRGRECGQICPV